jgi:uncharacterized caspase-like protein
VRRLALVVGIADYQSDPLSNPVRDARLVDKALRSRGFNCTMLEDPDVRTLEAALDSFSLFSRLRVSGGTKMPQIDQSVRH